MQYEVNRYICSRMLEDECDFGKMILNPQYEGYYSELKSYYTPASFDRYPVGKEFCFDDYNRIIRSALFSKNMNGKPTMRTFIIIYVLTKHLVVKYNEEKRGYYFCGWMNYVLDECDINWSKIVHTETNNSCQIL